MVERRLSRWVASVTGLAAAGLMAGCAATGDDPAADGWSVAESQAPLRMPALPPEVRLLGMEPGMLQSLLGAPSVQRSEQQAQYWRYSLGRCQLDLFLYPDPATGQQEVAYFEVRPTGHEIAGRAGGCAEVAKHLDRPEPELPPVEAH